MARSSRCYPPIVEAALPDAVRDALPIFERLLRVRRGRWDRVPALASVLEALAVASLAEALEDDGASRTAAVRRACLEVGADPDTMDRRLRRWRDGAMGT